MTRHVVSELAREGLRRVPRLDFGLHKGSCGRVAVIGGSDDYSGAPFLAAMSALRCGADLVHVICPPAVAPVIKAYSPDLVVRGIFVLERLAEVITVMHSCHAVVIGPGLSAASALQNGDPNQLRRMFSLLLSELLRAPELSTVPVVLDACALKLLCELHGDNSQGEGLRLLPRFVLTPNANEFRALCSVAAQHMPPSTGGAASSSTSGVEYNLLNVANYFNATVLLKGAVDIVAGPTISVPMPCQSSSTAGCPRRAAGQGDVLCGAVSAFLAFQNIWERRAPTTSASVTADAPFAAAAAAASTVVKAAARSVFSTPGGSTFIASDLLEKLGVAKEELSVDPHGASEPPAGTHQDSS